MNDTIIIIIRFNMASPKNKNALEKFPCIKYF
jgi:hypothetical protein